MTWTKDTPQGTESAKCRFDIVPYTRGTGLDVGCGAQKAFPHFIGVDSGKDALMFGNPVCADIKCDALSMPIFADGSMDFVFSSHLLEHIKDHEKALAEWFRIVKPGGYLVLYLPHADFYPNMAEFGANKDHVHDFLPQDIIDAMRKIGSWELIENEERNEEDEYSMLLVFQKRDDGVQIAEIGQKPSKTCAILRFGAWGDLIQVSSILPGLKEAGYHVTLFTSDRGYEVIEHDPHIDRIVLQDTNQVPNEWLGAYAAHLRKRYSKVIDLSESVEGQFLAMPNRINYHWPKEARHAVMNRNYTEILHSIAGVDYEGAPQMRFFATERESKWTRSQVKEFDAEPLIMLVLAGSAIHKVYPHLDSVVDAVLGSYANAKIVTVGNDKCRDILEEPWRKHPRMVLRSGVWSIRETIVMAQHCNLVIGPETGVMSAVAMESMPKVVMLSHSSVENLTRDWVNTITLSSRRTPCHPCHKMIYDDWKQCFRDKSGTAKCMADIPPETVIAAVKAALPIRQLRAA
jgi:ADP-heptose:LPS heptosyltransferase/predicted SAM-dependent methyltransferase